MPGNKRDGRAAFQCTDADADRYDFDEYVYYEPPETDAERKLRLQDYLESFVVARDEEYEPTVYVDRTIIRTDHAWELVEKFYAEKYPGRRCHFEFCERGKLSMGNLVRYPGAEALFLSQGYVSDIDVRSFGRGSSRAVTVYVRHNEDICFHQLRTIATLLRSGVGGLTRIRDIEMQLGELMGGNAKGRVPLVGHAGMLLPRRTHWRDEKIHLTYSADLSELLVADRGNPIEICGVSPLERDDQITFEVANGAALFGGATSEAVTLWQTQVLGILRKAVEEISFRRGRALNSEETEATKSNQQVLRSLLNPNRGGHPVDLEFHVLDYKRVRSDSVDEYVDILEEHFNGHRIPMLPCVEYGISPAFAFVAALNGSTYAPHLDFEYSNDLQDVSLTLQPLGRWIWALKNRRHATLDRSMARNFLEVLGVLSDDDEEQNLTGFRDMLAGCFAEAVWEVLGSACEDLVEDSHANPISVTYEWSRDVDHPWSASRTGDELLIRGPMLDFPLRSVSYWNEHAGVIEEEGGFTLHRAR